MLQCGERDGVGSHGKRQDRCGAPSRRVFPSFERRRINKESPKAGILSRVKGIARDSLWTSKMNGFWTVTRGLAIVYRGERGDLTLADRTT